MKPSKEKNNETKEDVGPGGYSDVGPAPGAAPEGGGEGASVAVDAGALTRDRPP